MRPHRLQGLANTGLFRLTALGRFQPLRLAQDDLFDERAPGNSIGTRRRIDLRESGALKPDSHRTTAGVLGVGAHAY